MVCHLGIVAWSRTEPARAQTSITPSRRSSSPFWRTVRRPELRRASRLQLEGRTLLREASSSQVSHARDVLLDGAVRALRRANRLAPEEPSILFDLAEALSISDGSDPEARDREALELLGRLQVVDPTYEPAAVGFRQGVVLTRRMRFAEAIEAYERALRFAIEEQGSLTTITHSNLAETLMSLGRLDEAIRHYEISIEVSEGLNVLGIWGLAVALDRSGRAQAALQAAQRALTSDPRDPEHTMQALRDPGVFFVPEHDGLYYFALGYEARAALATTDSDRVRDERRAADQWRAYLALGGSDGPWASSARAHLDALEARHAPTSTRARSR